MNIAQLLSFDKMVLLCLILFMLCTESTDSLALEAGVKKLVIWSDENCDFNVTQFLIDGIVEKTAKSQLLSTENVLPQAAASESFSYNIFECHQQLVSMKFRSLNTDVF